MAFLQTLGEHYLKQHNMMIQKPSVIHTIGHALITVSWMNGMLLTGLHVASAIQGSVDFCCNGSKDLKLLQEQSVWLCLKSIKK